MSDAMIVFETEQFAKAANAFLKRTDGRFEQKLRRIAMAVLRNVVLLQTERKAVDTGLSRANWQVRVGEVTDDILSKDTDPIQNALTALAEIPNHGIGQVIFIYNNVEYTIYLEFGTDKMAPRAMLRDSMNMIAATLA